MAVSAELLEFLSEQMSGFAPVSRRPMFGGAGFFRDGRMFALVAGDTLYLKADAETAHHFDAEGLTAFTYGTKAGDHTITSYRRAPASCLDDREEMARWCGIAWSAALRAGARTRPKAKQKLSKKN